MSDGKEEKKEVLSTRMKDVLAGGMAGGATRFIIAPLDVVKIRFQVQVSKQCPKYRTVPQTIKLIAKEEGLRALWKGNLTAEYLWIAFAAAQFATYHATVDFLPRTTSNKRSVIHYVTGGSFAGILSTVVTYPLDLVRTRLAAQGEPRIYKSLTDCFRNTIRHHGVLSLWNGVVPTIIQIVPSMAIQFTAYETLTDAYLKLNASKEGSVKEAAHTSPIEQLAIGAISGVAAKLGVMPMDTVKKRIQMSGVVRDAKYGETLSYKSTFDCVTTIARTEGFKGFYKGTVPSLYKAAPGTALTFMFYEQFKQLLNQF